MKNYDIIIAGGGAAGLSLAYYLSLSGLKKSRVLIIDKDSKSKNDRTWGFWHRDKIAFQNIIHLRFHQLDFYSRLLQSRIPLGDYQYSIIRGIDFYDFVKNHLKAFSNFTFLNAIVKEVSNEEANGVVATDAGTFKAKWVFSSIFNEDEIRKAAASKLYLRQHFKGWLIKTPVATFDPSAFTMFDFRTPQQNLMRFFYVIPYSEHQALVEYTLFSEHLLNSQEYDQAIKSYISEVLKIDDYEVVDEEFGVIPMTDYRFPAGFGNHIVNIGSLGGNSKPSSGYTFMRIQNHVQKIVAALELGKNPVISGNSSSRYMFYDSVLLNILKNQGGLAEKLFSYMFKNNSPKQLFQFLDESGGFLNDLKIISSLPPLPFLRSTIGLVARR